MKTPHENFLRTPLQNIHACMQEHFMQVYLSH